MQSGDSNKQAQQPLDVSSMNAFKKSIESLSIDSAEFEIKRMENSIRQLGITEQSLQEAMSEESTDTDDRQLYEETIEENKQLLKKIEMRIRILKEHISNLKEPGSDHVTIDTADGSNLPPSSAKTEEPADFKDDVTAGLIL